MAEQEPAPMDPELQEALSIRYVVGLRLAKLTSGNWAIWDGVQGQPEIRPEGELWQRVQALGQAELCERLLLWEELEERQARGLGSSEPPKVIKAEKTLEDMGL